MKTKLILQASIFVPLLLLLVISKAQSVKLPNAFAHNDYRHKRPLLDALENGFTYVEADIYLRGNKLIVSHILPILKKNRTLEELYFKPLLDYIKDKNSEQHIRTHITLMIDIKSNAHKTFAALAVLLEKYKAIISTYEDGKVYLRDVTIVITGHKPLFLFQNNLCRNVFLDEDLQMVGQQMEMSNNPIASCKYSRILKWKGRGAISVAEREILKAYVDKAHKNGFKVRLWASPERKTVWDELLKCNVDLINTNKLEKLRDFLVSEKLSLTELELLPTVIENDFPAMILNK